MKQTRHVYLGLAIYPLLFLGLEATRTEITQLCHFQTTPLKSAAVGNLLHHSSWRRWRRTFLNCFVFVLTFCGFTVSCFDVVWTCLDWPGGPNSLASATPDRCGLVVPHIPHQDGQLWNGCRNADGKYTTAESCSINSTKPAQPGFFRHGFTSVVVGSLEKLAIVPPSVGIRSVLVLCRLTIPWSSMIMNGGFEHVGP